MGGSGGSPEANLDLISSVTSKRIGQSKRGLVTEEWVSNIGFSFGIHLGLASVVNSICIFPIHLLCALVNTQIGFDYVICVDESKRNYPVIVEGYCKIPNWDELRGFTNCDTSEDRFI